MAALLIVVPCCLAVVFVAFAIRYCGDKRTAKKIEEAWERECNKVDTETSDSVIDETEQSVVDTVIPDTPKEEYWITESGTLHNSTCRWYKESEGSVWDGEAPYDNCALCGGKK